MQLNKKPIKVLGFDPSMSNWGVVAALFHPEMNVFQVKHIETISPSTNLTKQHRHIDKASQLYTRLMELVKQADLICVEVPVGSQDFNAAVSYSMCCTLIGAIRALMIPMVLVSPQDVKAVIGDPTASKSDIVQWVQEHHPEAKLPTYRGKVNVSKANHMCDAIVVLHAALNTPEFNKTIEDISWKSVLTHLNLT